MTTPTFPTALADKQDSAKFSIEPEDPALISDMDGGYVVSRPRHTRKPRRTYSSGLTDMLDAEKTAFDDFYDSVHGGSVIFYWKNPATGLSLLVRFRGKPQWQYSGIGNTRRWACTFKVEEA